MNQILVSVEPTFIVEQSETAKKRFVFSYRVTIENSGSVSAQLISRHWIITNGNGDTQEVRGDGVLGDQPHIAPGERFSYTSGAILETAVGSMHGSYQMVNAEGESFEAPIAPFTLAGPMALH